MLRLRLSVRVSLAVVVALLVTTSSARAEEVDNPRYTRWASSEIGSTATYSGEVVMGPNKVPLKSVYKLAEKTPAQVVIEITMTMTMGGADREMPAQKVTIAAKSEKADVKELGKEEIEAGGKKYACTIYELSNAIPQMKDAKLKAWINDEIPGGIAKMEMTAPDNTMTMTLKSFEKK
jgi:hypothetical protein